MAGVRFEDVDLLGALSRIVDLHTQHYKEDFDLDKELISKLAVSDRSEDKQLLWMSRPCGTYTLREREVYLDGSHENKVWRFYQEQTNDPVLAYAISLKEVFLSSYRISLSFNQSFVINIRSISISSPSHFYFVLYCFIDFSCPCICPYESS